ncbi:MAG: hypothetical protein M0R28_21560 [Pigmentiphaga sp.]|nr:hypothetical protein [Pigmentiphaga sp.]
MKRLTKLLMLTLALSVGPATLAAAQAAPFGVEISAAPVMLATTTVADAPEATAPEAAVPPVESWNPADWFKDAAVLAGVIAALVALIKANFLRDLHGLGTLALSFGLGIGISLLGTIDLPVIGRPSDLTGVAAIMFGINAAVFASGGWDAIRGLLLGVFGGNSRGATEAT